MPTPFSRSVVEPFSHWFVRVRHLAPLAMILTLLTASGCSHKSATAPELSASGTGVVAVQDLETAQPFCARPSNGRLVHLEGQSESGALWVLDKPAAWNGELVVYLHGYSNPTDPIALPANGEIRDSLMARGFAVAASSYSSNGYAVAEGMRESHQLNGIFASRVARPRRTYLFGQSLGGLIGLLLSQKYPEQYDGSMLVCGIVGGSDDEVQYMGDIRVLFDAAYPGVLPGDLEHPPVITDINAQVVQPVLAAINANPQGLGIILALARRPLPGANTQEIVSSLITVLGFAMQGGGDLFTRTHGHSYFDNGTWRYTSTALPAALVEDINARVARYTRTPDAAAFLARYGEPSGPLRIPVLTLHTTRDPVVPVFHEDLLAQVDAGPWLVQNRVEGYGHTKFSVSVLMANFSQLVNWASARPKLAV